MRLAARTTVWSAVSANGAAPGVRGKNERGGAAGRVSWPGIGGGMPLRVGSGEASKGTAGETGAALAALGGPVLAVGKAAPPPGSAEDAGKPGAEGTAVSTLGESGCCAGKAAGLPGGAAAPSPVDGAEEDGLAVFGVVICALAAGGGSRAHAPAQTRNRY